MATIVQYEQCIHTREIVKFLMRQRDQVASTKDIAEEFLVSEGCVLRGLARLKKVNRVAEIHSNLWHLE